MSVASLENILTDRLKEVLEDRDIAFEEHKLLEMKLIGQEAILDSLGLVTFLVELEQEINLQYDLDISLMDDRAMSVRNSPFRSVETLMGYIKELMNTNGK